jgi:hypothetical protein
MCTHVAIKIVNQREKTTEQLCRVSGEPREQITIVNDVAAETYSERTILLVAAMRKDLKSTRQSKI